MKIDKNAKLEKIIEKLASSSIVDGKLSKAKVNQVINTLKGLSKEIAISGLSLYLKLLKTELDKHRLVIEAPIELTDKQITEIEKAVSRKTPVFETEVLVNPNLIAGLRVRIGDNLLDDSLSQKINEIGKAIKE